MPYLYLVGDDTPLREITTEKELQAYAEEHEIDPEDLEIRADLPDEGGIQEAESRFAPANTFYQKAEV